MDLVTLSLLILISAIISGFISVVVNGLGFLGIAGVCISIVIGVPFAYIIFFHPIYKRKIQGKMGYVFPALIPIVITSIWVGWAFYDQKPEVMFRRLLIDPIPGGISNIRSKDVSTFSVIQLVAFDTTPQAIDEIIAKNELGLVENCPRLIPLGYFPEIQKNQVWHCYTKMNDETSEWGVLWINNTKSSAVFRLDAGG